VERVSRFACVLVEHFDAAAVERCAPALRERPLAILNPSIDRPNVGREGAPAAKIMTTIEANTAAREQGVRPGMTETEARARCPMLLTRPWVEEYVASARHALLEAALAVSPRIEDGGAGLAYVDTVGLERLIGDPASIGRRLVHQVRAIGLIPRVGLAASRTAARMAAATGSGAVTVIPSGRERAILAKTPITTLDLAPDLAATLSRWGVRTLGELAALPREGLATRLGPPGLRAHDLALGLDRDPFRPWTPPPFWEEAQGLEWEIDSLGVLAGVLEIVLERLCRRLAGVALVADALEIRLGLASGGHHARDIALAYPMSEVKPMLTLAVLDLEAHPPPAAVTRVAISAHPIRTQAGQGGLWQPPAPAPRDLVTVLARLAALVGADNLGSPVLVDSHRSDAFTMLAFSPPSEPASPDRGRRGGVSRRQDSRALDDPARLPGVLQHPPARRGQQLALRRMRPARRVEVETVGERPVRVKARLVIASAGPWRASGEWWDLQAWARDEWDVVLGDGALCRIARDRLAGHWYLDGFYD
jgi:protein ImuB